MTFRKSEMDPEVIVISDEEVEEKEFPYNIDENSGAIIISDEENFSDDMYEISTPEVSLTSDEEEDDEQPENIQELSSSVEEYLSSAEDEFDDDTSKRKLEQVTEEDNIDQKRQKTEPEIGTQKITTVREMIFECKKMLTSSNSILLVEEGECSKNFDIDSVKLPIEKDILNNADGNTAKEIKSGEVSDADEGNYLTNLIELPEHGKETGDDVVGKNLKDNLTDVNHVFNEKKPGDLSDGLKDKINCINENNVTKNIKSFSDLSKNKYSSKESLFIETTDLEKEVP